MTPEQVLTGDADGPFEIDLLDQDPRRVAEILSSVVPSLEVLQGRSLHPPTPRPERASPPLKAGERSKGRLGKAQTHAAAKRRGGWPSSRSLSWDDVREIDGMVHELARCGFAPTHFVTIMPPRGSASSRKRECTREIAHLGQALKRHGKPHVGITIFENPTGADLHAHHLVHAPSAEHATIKRRQRLPDVHVRRIRKLDGVVRYLTKERRHLSPDFEARIRHPWQRCQLVPGKKWTMTSVARKLLIGR
jgi:hypothetical protein